jgi:hypothetical protein
VQAGPKYSERIDHFCFWHIASFGCPAEFGRYLGQADIDQAAPIKPDL